MTGDDGPSSSTTTVRLAALTAARGGLFFAFWILLVDEVDLPNLMTGIGVALLAAAVSWRLESLRRVQLVPRLSMFRYAYRPPLLLFTDTVRVMAVLFQALLRPNSGERGHLRATHYRSCQEDADDTTRRVLTEWAGSLGSNRYVVGIDDDAEVLIVHELKHASGPLDPLELG